MAAGVAALLLAGFGGWEVWRSGRAPSAAPSLPAPVIGVTAAPKPVAGVTALGRSAPVRIEIASINVRASVDQIGLAADGTMAEQPLSRADRAAWYKLGPSPGQLGPAVIVGHV